MKSEPMRVRSFMVHDTTWRAAQRKAQRRGVPLSEAIREFLDLYGQPDPPSNTPPLWDETEDDTCQHN